MDDRSPLKRPLGIDVLTAARQRIATVFDHFPRICVSFSGGKDSTVLLHLTMEEAIRRQRKVGLLFIDWEAQFALTIDFVRECFRRYADYIEPHWCALPLKTTNACSQIEPEWICWEEGKEDRWVRPLPPEANHTSGNAPDFFEDEQTFEEFVPEFGHWFGGGQLTACLVGIRSDESLNRFRTIVRKKTWFRRLPWTTWLGRSVFNAYPIYDWRTEDVWTYFGKFGLPYNRLYDRMHQAGLSIHQQRICEPYGDEQRKGLWLYHIIEPETWPRVMARVSGANFGAEQGRTRGNIMGNGKIELPSGHSWQSFANLLLDSMPGPTADHYRDKIAHYINYCMGHYDGRYAGGLPQEAENDTGGKDIPSWRRICKVLLKNDYWCKGLSFSPNKAAGYEAYKRVMKKRRSQWGLM